MSRPKNFSDLRSKKSHSAVHLSPLTQENQNSCLGHRIDLWLAVLAGLAIRIYLAIWTNGTYDVNIWNQHALSVGNYGLINYYHANPEMNHPPFVSMVISKLGEFSQATGIPFRVLLRTPFILVDLGILLLLLSLLCQHRYRFPLAIFYWLNPLTIIFSAYHGNTDMSVAFFLLLGVYLLSRQKVITAAIVLGISLWIKLPSVLALPAMFFFIEGWRKKFSFLFIVALTGISTYIPAMFIDADIVCKNVFGYQGQIIHTSNGTPVWGNRIFFAPLQFASVQWQQLLVPPILFYLRYNMWFCILLILLLTWLRRSLKTVPQLCLTIAGVYMIINGFSNYWSFQYLSWSIPFWFFAPVRIAIPATILAGGYIYLLYWHLCGNPWLLGLWDFIGHPQWPGYIEILRDGALLYFVLAACVFLLFSAYTEIPRLRQIIHKAN